MASNSLRATTPRWTLYVDESFEEDLNLVQAFLESDLPGVVIRTGGAPDVPALVSAFQAYRGARAIAEFLLNHRALLLRHKVL